MIKTILTLVLLINAQLLLSQASQVMLKTNAEGEVVYGSVEKLIEEINKGRSLRVSWDLDFDKDKKADLTHWIDANFITIIGGHVFNQVDPIYAQLPNTEIPQVNMMRSDWTWTAIIGTNGILKSRFIIPNIDKIDDEKRRESLLKKSEIREKLVATIWSVR